MEMISKDELANEDEFLRLPNQNHAPIKFSVFYIWTIIIGFVGGTLKNFLDWMHTNQDIWKWYLTWKCSCQPSISTVLISKSKPFWKPSLLKSLPECALKVNKTPVSGWLRAPKKPLNCDLKSAKIFSEDWQWVSRGGILQAQGQLHHSIGWIYPCSFEEGI